MQSDHIQHCSRRVKFPPKAGGLALHRGSVSHTLFLCADLQIARMRMFGSPLYKKNEGLKGTFDLSILLLTSTAKFDWSKRGRMGPFIADDEVTFKDLSCLMAYDIGRQFRSSQRQYSNFISLSAMTHITTAPKQPSGFNVFIPSATLWCRATPTQLLHRRGAMAQTQPQNGGS